MYYCGGDGMMGGGAKGLRIFVCMPLNFMKTFVVERNSSHLKGTKDMVYSEYV